MKNTKIASFTTKLLSGKSKNEERRQLNKLLSNRVRRGIEDKDTKPINDFFKYAEGKIKEIDPDFKGLKKYNLPQYIEKTILEKVRPEVDNLAYDLSKIKNPTDIEFNNLLSATSPETQKIIRHLLKQVKDPNVAIKSIRKRAASAAFDYMSFMRDMREELLADVQFNPSYLKHRRFDLSGLEEYLEWDLTKILPRYAKSISQWIASQKAFGRNEKLFQEKLAKLRYKNPKEAALVSKVKLMWTGEYDAYHGLTGMAKNVINEYMGFQVFTKIGLGQATLLNFGQPFISIIPDWGVWNTIKGGMALLDKEHREFIKMTGAIDRDMLLAIMGHHPEGFFGKIADVTTIPFQEVNRGLQYLSASTASIGLPKLHKMAQGNSAKANWAKKRLADFNIDYTKPISKKRLLKACYRYATDSQLQKNVLEDPIIVNDPTWRPLFLFKQFGMKQFNYIKDMQIRELQRGNVMPLVRLGLGGWLAGSGVYWAINTIRETLSGEPVYDPRDSLTEEILNDVSYIGAFGFLSNMLTFTDKFENTWANIGYAISPVMVSEPLAVLAAFTKTHGDWKEYGDGWLAVERNSANLMRPFGTFTKDLSKQLKPEGQIDTQMKFKKREEREAIFRFWFEGDAEAASNRIKQWNKTYPDYPIRMDEVSLGKLTEWMERQAEKYARGKYKEDSVDYEKRKQERLKKLRKQMQEVKERNIYQTGVNR